MSVCLPWVSRSQHSPPALKLSTCTTSRAMDLPKSSLARPSRYTIERIFAAWRRFATRNNDEASMVFARRQWYLDIFVETYRDQIGHARNVLPPSLRHYVDVQATNLVSKTDWERMLEAMRCLVSAAQRFPRITHNVQD